MTTYYELNKADFLKLESNLQNSFAEILDNNNFYNASAADMLGFDEAWFELTQSKLLSALTKLCVFDKYRESEDNQHIQCYLHALVEKIYILILLRNINQARAFMDELNTKLAYYPKFAAIGDIGFYTTIYGIYLNILTNVTKGEC